MVSDIAAAAAAAAAGPRKRSEVVFAVVVVADKIDSPMRREWVAVEARNCWVHSRVFEVSEAVHFGLLMDVVFGTGCWVVCEVPEQAES